jgi:hypothetical protein
MILKNLKFLRSDVCLALYDQIERLKDFRAALKSKIDLFGNRLANSML